MSANRGMEYLPKASRRLHDELRRHCVPEVLTSEAARNDIGNAIKELEYAFQSELEEVNE